MLSWRKAGSSGHEDGAGTAQERQAEPGAPESVRFGPWSRQVQGAADQALLAREEKLHLEKRLPHAGGDERALRSRDRHMLLEEEFIEHLGLCEGTGLEARLARRRRRRTGLLTGANPFAAENAIASPVFVSIELFCLRSQTWICLLSGSTARAGLSASCLAWVILAISPSLVTRSESATSSFGGGGMTSPSLAVAPSNPTAVRVLESNQDFLAQSQ